jgi:uncharacterized tellurite resistance protein B-like protein
MAAYLTPMLQRIKALLASGRNGSGDRAWDDLAFAVAALMVEAAGLDDRMDAAERARIAALLARRFDLAAADAAALLAAAERRMADTHQIYPYARTVKDRLSEAERIAIAGMLWEVILADGRVHDHEANLMRRIGGLIAVRDVDIGAARKRALARMGREAADRDAQAEDGSG